MQCFDCSTYPYRDSHQCVQCIVGYIAHDLVKSKVEMTSKEEKYREIFNHKKEALTISQMTREQIVEHIHLLESTLEQLIFEKRTEILAARTHLEDVLENESETEKNRIRKMDRD